jgi:tetratricopeptide (TPR) repeat protein
MRSAMRIVAVVLAIVAIDFLCVAPYRANLAIAAITQNTLVVDSVDAVAAAPAARANLTDLANIARPERLNPNWYLLYGANCEILGRNAEAADAYTRALAIDQRPEIYVHRGMLLLQQGRVDAAVHDLATAARFDEFVLYDLTGDVRARVAAESRVR